MIEDTRHFPPDYYDDSDGLHSMHEEPDDDRSEEEMAIEAENRWEDAREARWKNQGV